jgi:protein gp37
MGENSKIEWTDHTFNPWIGCTKVSPGCANCYAEKYGHRFGVPWGRDCPRRRTSAANWRLPLRWNKQAEESGIRPRVFCASLADWLDEAAPVTWLADLLALISWTPCLDWLLLTKRPQNWRTRLAEVYEDNPQSIGACLAWDWFKHGTPPSNVLIGATAEDQARANERIPILLQIPARSRFLSCEPLLGPVDLCLSELWEPAKDVDWVICGGESGPGARPMAPKWAQSLRDQCQVAAVPFFFKQWGSGSACRLLDGREWNELPVVFP